VPFPASEYASRRPAFSSDEAKDASPNSMPTTYAERGFTNMAPPLR